MRRLEPVHGNVARVFGERENRDRVAARATFPTMETSFAPTGPLRAGLTDQGPSDVLNAFARLPQRHSVGVSGEAHVECDFMEHHADLAKSSGCFLRRPLHFRQE